MPTSSLTTRTLALTAVAVLLNALGNVLLKIAMVRVGEIRSFSPDVLGAAGERTGFSTTVDFKVTEHEWANDTRQSTQEAVEVQEFFAELLVAGGTWGVLEATSHALALRKLMDKWDAEAGEGDDGGNAA